MRDKRKAKADLHRYLEALHSHITRSKQAESGKNTEEVGESELIFRAIFDNAADGILLADVESRKFYIGNKVICQMLGCDEGELKNLGVMDIHPEESLSYVIEQFRKQMKGEITLAKDMPVKRKDGSVFYADINAFPITFGQKTYLMGIFRDITERRKAEEEVRKFKTIADRAGYGVAMSDLEGKLIYLNESFAKMHGYKTSELIGSQLSIFHNEEQKQRVGRLNERLLKEGSYVAKEVWHKRKDDTIFPTLMNATLIKDNEAKPLFLACTAVEITELKQAEQEMRRRDLRLQYLVASSPAVIYTCKTSGDYGATFISENVVSLTGYKPKDFVENSSFWIDHIHPEDRDHVLNGVSVIFQKGYHNHEYRFLHKDGFYQWMYDELKLVRDEKGNPLEIMGYWTDITQRKKAELALQESELRYRTLFETLPIGVGLATLEGQIVDVNSSILQTTGYLEKEIKQKNVSEMYQNAEERALLVKQLQKDGFVRDFETQLKRKDGTPYYVSLNVTPMKFSGETLLVTVASDVTERKRMEKELHESEEKYRTVVETTSDPIILIDKNGVILFANRATAEDFGCKPEELVKKTLWDIFSKDDADNQAASICKVIETGRGMNLIALTNIRGESRWHNVNIEPLKDRDGNAIAALVVARNIHDIRQAEEQIQKLSSAVEQSIDGIGIGDLESKILYANNAYARMHGYAPEEMVGMDVANLQGDGYMDRYKQAQHLIKTRGSWTGEMVHVRKDGTDFPVYISVTLLKDDTGQATGIIAVCRDITEYKKTQKDLMIKDAAIASSINAIAIGDSDGNLTYVNKSCLDMWGYSDPKEVLGKHVIEFCRDKEETLRVIETLREKGGWIGELTVVRKNGSTFIAQICATLVTDDNGKPISMMGSFIDITESKRSQEQLNAYREKMARTEQLAALGTLSATLAHELTQPLTIIRLSLESAVEKLGTVPSPESFANKIKDSLNQISSMAAITGRFRNFARRSSEHIFGVVDLKVVAERIVTFLSESAKRVRVELRLEDWDEIPPMYWNENDLEQLFFALVNNTIQAADGKKDRWLIIRGFMKNKNIELQFSDDCGGISPDDLDRIFEPFFTTKPPGLGTGLGLCIVQDIVTRAGGRIRVESKFGEGSTFFVTLPVNEDRTSQLGGGK